MVFRTLLLLLTVFTIIACDEESKTVAVDDLLDAFSGGCNTSAWTTAAIERSTQLTTRYLRNEGPKEIEDIILTLVSRMEWPSDINKDLCKGALIFSRDMKLPLSFEELEKKFATPENGLDDRLCAHEDFLRLDRLAGQNLKTPGDVHPREQRMLWQQILDDKFSPEL